ncbi:SET domain containing protein [Amanita muscaria]
MHKLECVALQSWAKTAPSAEVAIPSDAVRCLGRVLWRQKKSGGESYFCKEFNTMQSHRSDLQPCTYELHTHLAHALKRYLNLTSPQEMQTYGLASIADLVDLISRFTTNTVVLTTPSLTPIGACISPSIALLNHSCDPNAVIVFPRNSANPKLHEPLLQVIAIKPINPGEELLTAYIDTTLPREDRRKTLKETYSFDCRCKLCCPPLGFVDPREALLCPTRKDPSSRACSGICEIPAEGVNVSRCNVCNLFIDPKAIEEIRDALRVSQKGLVKAGDLEYKDPERAIRLASNLMGILTSAGLAAGTHPLLALSRLHSSMLVENLPDLSAVIGPAPPFQLDPLLSISGQSTLQAINALQQPYPLSQGQTQDAEDAQGKLDNAIRAALCASTGLATVLVPGHPLRGLALAELGKLLSVDEPVPKYLAGNDNRDEPDQKGVFPPSGPARLRLARETLIRARMELMVGFGGVNEGGEVGMEVRDWLVRVDKELQVWKVGMQSIPERR